MKSLVFTYQVDWNFFLKIWEEDGIMPDKEEVTYASDVGL